MGKSGGVGLEVWLVEWVNRRLEGEKDFNKIIAGMSMCKKIQESKSLIFNQPSKFIPIQKNSTLSIYVNPSSTFPKRVGVYFEKK